MLISYITTPFKKGIKKNHSNQIEAIKIAEIFDELGYIVDIYNYQFELSIKVENYDVIFGIGKLFENLIQKKEKSKKYIFYATGAYFCFANSSELERLRNLYNRKNIHLKPRRFILNPTYYATQYADAIIITGNDWTISTYINSKIPIYKVPVSVYDINWKNTIEKNFTKSKKNFLWFGSSGLVHKGLDLCLEVFKDLEDYNLYICGPKEDDFFRVYKEEFELPNIHYKGFVDINSEEFKNITEKCVFSIFPSCSEGQSGSVLTTMSVGLIPVVTQNVGVDIKNKGFIISEKIDNIKEKIMMVSNLNYEELANLSLENIKYIQENHKIKHFKDKMKENLIQILGEK